MQFQISTPNQSSSKMGKTSVPLKVNGMETLLLAGHDIDDGWRKHLLAC